MGRLLVQLPAHTVDCTHVGFMIVFGILRLDKAYCSEIPRQIPDTVPQYTEETKYHPVSRGEKKQRIPHIAPIPRNVCHTVLPICWILLADTTPRKSFTVPFISLFNSRYRQHPWGFRRVRFFFQISKFSLKVRNCCFHWRSCHLQTDFRCK